MSLISIPIKIKCLLDLIRINKPIGFLLLMWPCWFALAILPINPFLNLKWFFLFFIGSFLMRSAGCIINDFVDIKIDKKIKRTSERPLTSKKIKKFEAIIFLVLILLLAFLILIQFNTKAIIVSLFSLPLIVLYPFMKRFTYWPQLMLGIVFNWGILIVAIQFYQYIPSIYIIFYIGCIFWTLGYDTIYAYQDRKDDIKNDIKSTAVLFDYKGKYYVLLFYIIFLIILGYIGFWSSNSIISIFVIIMFLFIILLTINKWDYNSKNSSNIFFRLNSYFGLICFIYLIIF